jgi:DNA end-binding protein Ku
MRTLKKQARRKTNTIEILQFVNEKEIDSIYFEKPYYLVPDKGAAKAYALLLKALEKAKQGCYRNLRNKKS